MSSQDILETSVPSPLEEVDLSGKQILLREKIL